MYSARRVGSGPVRRREVAKCDSGSERVAAKGWSSAVQRTKKPRSESEMAIQALIADGEEELVGKMMGCSTVVEAVSSSMSMRKATPASSVLLYSLASLLDQLERSR